MTREVAHFQQFEAALDTIQPNFPPGVLQSDPRYSNIYSNHSMGEDAREPWNEGESIGLGEEWLYVENPRQQVLERQTGSPNSNRRAHPARRLRCAARTSSAEKQRSSEIRKATPEKNLQWSQYDSQDTKAPRRQPIGRTGLTPPPACRSERPGEIPGRSSCLACTLQRKRVNIKHISAL